MSWRERSFEVLPALRLGKKPLRSALKTVTVAWMFGIAWSSCITGSQMTSFLRLLGFEDYQLGIYSAIPYAATLGQLYAASIIERTGLRKYMFIYFACIHRMLWLVIALVPLVVSPGRATVVLFLVTYAVSCTLAHLSTPPWYDWMGSLIPRRIRGRYLGNRSLLTIPIQIVVVLVVGLVLDRLTLPMEPGARISILNQPYLLPAICAIIGVGAILGTTDILLFLRLREIVSPALVRQTSVEPPRRRWKALGEAVLAPMAAVVESFRDRVFRHYATYGAVIAFSISVSDQFFYANALERLGFGKFGTNLLFMVVGAFSSMLMARPWGALIDRWGRRPVLILATLGAALSPLPWFLMGDGFAHNFALAMAGCLIGGGTWCAINLAQTYIIMGFTERTGRSMYMAATATVTAVGGILGGAVGGAVAQWLLYFRESPLHVGPFLWNSYHATFLISMAGRGSSILLLLGMPDPGARPVGGIVRLIWFNAYGNVMSLLFWPLRVLGVRQPRESERDARPGTVHRQSGDGTSAGSPDPPQ